jgi:hypothetical protein
MSLVAFAIFLTCKRAIFAISLRATTDSLKQSKSIKPQVKKSRWRSSQKNKDPNTNTTFK